MGVVVVFSPHWLCNAPILAAPTFDHPFKLSVDANDAGVGALLLQKGDDGVELPFIYFSKKCNRNQQVCSTVEKDALTLVLAL